MIIMEIKSPANASYYTLTLPNQINITIKGANGICLKTIQNSYCTDEFIILDAGIWSIKNIELYDDSHTLFIEMANCNNPSLREDDGLWPFNNEYGEGAIIYNIVDGTTPADVETQYERLRQSVLEFIDR